MGRLLAQELGIEFLDTDEMVQAEEGMRIDELVTQRGWSHFRAVESQMLLKAVSGPRAVISTGGGMVLDPDNRKVLGERGYLIWLRADVETIVQRMEGDGASTSLRPRFRKETSLELETREQLKIRGPLYQGLADLTIDTGRIPPEAVLDKIMEAMDHGRF